MNVIAPYVKEHSYIEMVGEENTMWRWVFANGKLQESYPTTTWYIDKIAER